MEAQRAVTRSTPDTHRARLAYVIVASSVGLLACGPGTPALPDAATLGPTGAVCPPDSTLTYASFGKAFFDTYCQSCHGSSVRGAVRQGAPSSHAYDDVMGIRSDLAEIDRRAAAGPDAINVDMPRAFPVPSDAEREQLGEWLACGAPTTSPDEDS